MTTEHQKRSRRWEYHVCVCVFIYCICFIHSSLTGYLGHFYSLAIENNAGMHVGVHVWVCLVTQSCLTLCNPMDCSLPGSFAHGLLQTRILECCHALFQGIFPTQGSNPGPLHCRQILYRLSHQGVVVSYCGFNWKHPST